MIGTMFIMVVPGSVSIVEVAMAKLTNKQKHEREKKCSSVVIYMRCMRGED